METKLVSPDGVAVLVTNPIDLVNLKARGYTEAEDTKTKTAKTVKSETKTTK